MVVAEPKVVDTADYTLSEASSVTLDLIRLIAAQLVVVGHTIQGLGIFPSLQPPIAPYMQNVAVVVFFVLSGFLISYVVFARRSRSDYDFRAYFIDRFFRIYTGYLPAIVFVVVVDTLSIAAFGRGGYRYGDALNLQTVLGNLLMLQNYPLLPIITSLGSARTFWTLAIEWWIYLAFGWLLLAKNRFFWPALTFFAIVPIWNLFTGRGDGLTVMWLIGVAIYVVLSRHLLPSMTARMALALAAFCGILAGARIFATTDAYDTLFALFLGAALCLLLYGLDASRLTFSDTMKRFIRLGAGYSFTLYLTHLTIYALVERVVSAQEITVSPHPLFVGIFLLCNAVALALASFTEMRHKALANRFKQRYP